VLNYVLTICVWREGDYIVRGNSIYAVDISCALPITACLCVLWLNMSECVLCLRITHLPKDSVD